jgi:hypothetical protein
MNAIARIALPVALVALAALPARADDDARAKLLGTWQGTGTFYATLYSKAGPSSVKTTCQWQVDTTYLVCAQQFDGPDGPGNGLSIYTHGLTGYGFLGVDPNGKTRVVPVTVSPSGEIIYTSTFDDGTNGHVTVRTVNTFPSPDTEDWRTEYSLNGGKTWTKMADGVVHRLPPNAKGE